VLDTSSIFAFTDQEDGADEVEKPLDAAKQHECRLEVCTMSLMELYYITSREWGEVKLHDWSPWASHGLRCGAILTKNITTSSDIEGVLPSLRG
jgi:hypothetical protein